MKKNILAFTIAVLISASTLFAQDNKTVPNLISNEFNKEFTNVSNLQWKMVDLFYKASFISEGTELDVFYNPEGELQAVSRKLKVDQLPLALIKETKQKLINHDITELFELLTDKGTEYFLVISDEKGSKTYRSEGSGWARY